ncbi:MAG TPA: hypothetical protein VHQ65_16230, partial [Thermoanaerobaculia bacterium]|nr:hypothetical protein [Thermoanaerobaculia bacterium]
MSLWEIFRFEIGQQARRVLTWLYFAVLLALAYTLATAGSVSDARNTGHFLNAPFVIATVTLLGSMLGLFLTTGLAGDAAARDAQTRMHPLLYTTPLGKAAYLGGRFLAAFVLNATLLLAVPAGILLGTLLPRAEPELVGPFQAAPYLVAYLLLALPNAFVATALPFSLAALGRRAMASYLGSVLLLLATLLSWQLLAGQLGWWGLAKLLDPFGLTVMAELSRLWTAAEKDTLSIAAHPALLANRLLWIGIAHQSFDLTGAAGPLDPRRSGRRAAPAREQPGVSVLRRHRRRRRRPPPTPGRPPGACGRRGRSP